MKNVVRAMLLVFFSAGILWFMSVYGLFNMSFVLGALQHGQRWIGLVLVVQFMLAVFLLLRYLCFIQIFGIDVNFRQVTAATFVSNAVGQWAPGSLAVIEIIRVGLMVGAKKHTLMARASPANDALSPSLEGFDFHEQRQQQMLSSHDVPQAVQGSLHARLAVASLFDRLIGFFTMLAVGSVFAVLPLFLAEGDSLSPGQRMSLTLLAVASAGGALAIAVLPIVARWGITKLVLLKTQKACQLWLSHPNVGVQRVARVGQRLISQANSVREVIVFGSTNVKKFVLPFVLSMACLLSSCLALYFASRAVGETIALSAIAAAFPVIAIASLLPIGFAGMGGPQLVAVAIFGVFSLSPTAVSSASLLQSGLLLLENTILGLVFAHLSAAQIRAILVDRRKPTT